MPVIPTFTSNTTLRIDHSDRVAAVANAAPSLPLDVASLIAEYAADVDVDLQGRKFTALSEMRFNDGEMQIQSTHSASSRVAFQISAELRRLIDEHRELFRSLA